MEGAYQGNWVYRWGGGTPYMREANKKGKKESILAHQWSMMALWYQIRRLCPNLNAAVNSERVYEIVIYHDLGEIAQGDISMFRQIQGHGTNKAEVERQELGRLTSGVAPKTRKEILANFDGFERDPLKITDLEVLVAKFLDTFQGNHFASVFGNDLAANSEIISKIAHKRYLAYATNLINFLKKKHLSKAAKEVEILYQYHLKHLHSLGVNLRS